MIGQLLKVILITSLTGSGLALIVTLLKPITKKIFGYKWHYYIWLAVLVVMVLPVRFTFPDTQVVQIPSANTIEIQTIPNSGMVFADNTQNAPAAPTAEIVQIPLKENVKFLTQIIENKLNILGVIWLLGILMMLSVSIIGYFRLVYKVHRRSVVISCPEIQKYTKRKITVRICEDLASPFIMGIFRPSLILPNITLSAEQLDNILTHEMTHLKRNDIIYKWFATFVKALHWFNPIIYYITKQINIECEISCDLSVVKNMTDTQTENYVNTIISLLSAGRTKSIPLTTGMTGNKNTLKKRFHMIKNRFFVNKKVMIISAVSAILILALTISISGFLNGKWINFFNNTVLELNTDKRNGDTFNTLIVGIDEQNRADSIMLIKMSEDRIEGYSIPRNAVFDDTTISNILAQENSDQIAIDAIRNKLSVPITYYAKIKTDLIKDLVDSVGGLTVDVPMDMKYDDPYKDLHIDLTKGEAQILNGEQICGLLQFRRSNDGKGYPQGDLDRIKIGQQVLMAFISQNKLSDIAINSQNIIKSINKNVATNYPIKNFIKDRRLLSGKEIKFDIIPGNSAVNNGIFEYKVDSAALYGMLNPPIKINEPTENKDADKKHSAAKPILDTALTPVSATETQTHISTLNEYTYSEESERHDIPDFGYNTKYSFSSIEEAEQHLQAYGASAVNDKNFKAGSNYIKNNYSFDDGNNEKVSNITSNDNGEISMYFIGNLDTLMNVRFKDSETKDEVNSAIILAGDERIYKFTGLDPTKHYDIELSDLTEGEWKIKGQYIIF